MSVSNKQLLFCLVECTCNIFFFTAVAVKMSTLRQAGSELLTWTVYFFSPRV